MTFVYSSPFNLFTQGIRVTIFYGLWFFSCDPVLYVMSRRSYANVPRSEFFHSSFDIHDKSTYLDDANGIRQ